MLFFSIMAVSQKEKPSNRSFWSIFPFNYNFFDSQPCFSSSYLAVYLNFNGFLDDFRWFSEVLEFSGKASYFFRRFSEF